MYGLIDDMHELRDDIVGLQRQIKRLKGSKRKIDSLCKNALDIINNPINAKQMWMCDVETLLNQLSAEAKKGLGQKKKSKKK